MIKLYICRQCGNTKLTPEICCNQNMSKLHKTNRKIGEKQWHDRINLLHQKNTVGE